MHTGYKITIYKDTNVYSSTYNTTRTERILDVDMCPLPYKAICTLWDSSQVEIPDDGTTSLESFEVETIDPNRSSIVSVTFGPSINNIGWSAFEQQYNLTTVDIPSNIKSLGIGAFANCQNLSTFTIAEGLETIDNSCFSNTSLPTLTLPSTMTSIGNRALESNVSLTTVTCLATNPPTLGTNVFDGCNNLAHIYVPAASVQAYKTATNWSYYANIIEAIPNS